MIARRLAGVCLALLLLLSVVGTAAGVPSAGSVRPVDGSAGIGDPYAPEDGNGGIDVLHYQISDRYWFRPVRLTGTTTLRVRATEALASFHLDMLLPVRWVRVNGVLSRFNKPSRHELVVRPATPIAKGARFTVVVRYAGNPARVAYNHNKSWLSNNDEVLAAGEPDIAPWWFASNDHPADKATYDIAITTGAGKQVLSNGVQVAHVLHGPLATTRWRMSDPMATYLAFFAAGRFAIYRGRSAAGTPYVTAISRAFTAGERRKLEGLMRQTPAITDWLARELGPYPFATTGGVVTSLQTGYALENQSRPTYDYVNRTTIVHELAHQWFGDSVSVRRWRDIWLNEGFATYMEWRFAEVHGGRSTRDRFHGAYADSAGYESYWNEPLDNPGLSNMWGTNIYQRGAMTLAALRDRIGNADFRRLLRAWVAEHRGGNGTTAEFERLAGRISGQRLTAFFHTWLDKAAKPAKTRANGW